MSFIDFVTRALANASKLVLSNFSRCMTSSSLILNSLANSTAHSVTITLLGHTDVVVVS